MIQNMMRNSINNRRDIVTKKSFPRNELIRISISKEGLTKIDKEYKLGGRGIYVLPESIKEGLNNKIIFKNIKRFKGNFEEIKEDLLKEVK